MRPASVTQSKLERRLVRALDDVVTHDGPIIAGPWLGEVGWEVLYWIPLLRWCVARWPDLRERLVVVSRGGVGGWYEGIADTYFDVFEQYGEEAFSHRLKAERAGRKSRGQSSVKQREVSPWELEIAEGVRERLGLPAVPPMLHPALLFASMKFVLTLPESDCDVFRRWSRPGRGVLEGVLPERYVAVRFCESGLFQDSEFASRITSALAEHIPVVMIYPGMVTDYQHPDFDIDADVLRIASYMSFADNLAVQSAAIANAAAFVGNFGGLAFVGPHFGVPSFCFWSRFKTAIPRELEFVSRVFSRPGWGSLTARALDDAPFAELLTPILESISEEVSQA